MSPFERSVTTDYRAMLLLLDTAYACVRRRASELRESGDTRDDRIEAGDHSKHRDVLLAALEKRFAFKRKELPQWDAVDTTSRQANAVKHRLGLTFKDTAEGQLALEGVNLSERDLMLRLDNVHEWVIALGRTAGLNPSTRATSSGDARASRRPRRSDRARSTVVAQARLDG